MCAFKHEKVRERVTLTRGGFYMYTKQKTIVHDAFSLQKLAIILELPEEQKMDKSTLKTLPQGRD